jgi:hypothetical protein
MADFLALQDQIPACKVSESVQLFATARAQGLMVQAVTDVYLSALSDAREFYKVRGHVCR